mmetsp:Transcript_59704/g.176909  ORF Transcript_59704/g.176909 Transcript_59704/m.176909 type:complete len:262 (+) Transcript_59704:1160-1945(+)
MHPRVLQMFSNGVIEDGTIVRHRIEFNLLGVQNVLGHDHGLIGRDVHGQSQKVTQLRLVARHSHGRSGQYEGGSDQYRISDLIRKLKRLLLGRQYRPRRLTQTHLVEHVGELTTILGAFNVPRARAQYLRSAFGEGSGQIVGDLTSHGHNDARRTLPFVNVQYSLQGQFLKVETIGFIVVGRYGLGVVVHNDTLEPIPTELTYRRHSAPVEFDGGADAVRSASQYHDTSLLGIHQGIGLHGLPLLEFNRGRSSHRRLSHGR